MRCAMFGIIIALLDPTAGWLHAADGRDFAGFYRTADVVDLGDDVSLILKLRVINESGAEVNDATIRLENPVIPETVYGFFNDVWIAAGESIRLSGTFTVSRHEYDYWENGGLPHLRIHYADANGNSLERTIEVGPGLPSDEEQ